jgi:hypothetical protein
MVFFRLRLLRWARWTWALVIRLLFGRGPSNVARFVVSVIVGIPVDGVVRRRRVSDVMVKSEKVVFPFVTHDDASPSVVAVSSSIDPIAAVFDRAPDFVDGSSHHVVLDPTYAFGPKFPEFCVSRSGKHFFVQTAARKGVVSRQISGHDPKLVSALAPAFPVDASLIEFTATLWPTDYCQSSKLFVR